MAHVIERARSGRSKCRGCEGPIEKGALRFGERLANPFADDGGDTIHWFHVGCGALMRPEPFLDALPAAAEAIDRRDWLEREARLGIAHRRLPRATGIARAPSARAACRACRRAIDKGAWRIALRYHEAGRFAPSGFIHLECAAAYLETTDVVDRLRHFSPTVSESDLVEIRAALDRRGVGG